MSYWTEGDDTLRNADSLRRDYMAATTPEQRRMHDRILRMQDLRKQLNEFMAPRRDRHTWAGQDLDDVIAAADELSVLGRQVRMDLPASGRITAPKPVEEEPVRIKSVIEERVIPFVKGAV